MPEQEDDTRIDLHTDRPTPARMYDYMLGGKDNFAADREAAERFLAAIPEARVIARANRMFLQRAVRYLAAEAGCTLDAWVADGHATPERLAAFRRLLVSRGGD